MANCVSNSNASLAKMVICADGPVGAKVVRHALNFAPDRIAAIAVPAGDKVIPDLIRQCATPPKLIECNESDRKAFARELRATGAEIVFLAWWPYLLREELDSGQRVTLNLHPSRLPFGRGKDPNFWALADGEPFGVSIHRVVPRIDAGAIAYQRSIAYDWTDTAETLYKRAQNEIFDLFTEVLPRVLALDIPTIEQNIESGSFHLRKQLDARSSIDLDAPTTARQVLNLLRARTFRPHRGCQFTENGRTFDVAIDIREVAN